MSIDIAIIDSGINPTHPHVQGVAGGVSFDFNGKGRIIEKECFEDRIGHGTAIAGIFREALPTARIWALKVFQDDLTASSRLLLASLDWAVRADMKIIHLSLGTEREADHWPIEKLCQKAHQKGQLITAAARGCNDTVYPARLDTVIGTYWDKRCKPGTIMYHPNYPIEFGAWGHPRPLPGLDQRKNFCGSSFAAAHLSARAAQVLVSDPNADWTFVKQTLIHKAIACQCGDENDDHTPS
ncbi:peptidase, S8/S53 family [Desulfosarcina variabilis str. Montpellier]|uniref:S8 family serine peptidase n=1 Tax=Desulfosarcina variabilis TaxID=2300 RepID=UPI003AFAE8EB